MMLALALVLLLRLAYADVIPEPGVDATYCMTHVESSSASLEACSSSTLEVSGCEAA